VLVWLVGVIARLGAPKRSRLLHRIIGLCERNTEAMVFDIAAARAPPPQRRTRRLRAAPAGFRLKRIKGNRFFNHARVRLRAEAGFAARVRRLIAVLADPEPCVARATRLLLVGCKQTRIIATAPPAEPLRAAGFAPVAIDSS
jgi:hypothetical protein